MTREDRDFFAGSYIPKPSGPVTAAGRQIFAVRRESHTPDIALVSLEL
jgi:hypothetical protein